MKRNAKHAKAQVDLKIRLHAMTDAPRAIGDWLAEGIQSKEGKDRSKARKKPCKKN